MQKYTSCFIGIPLPEQYQQQFEALLIELSQINPQLEITSPLTPHITIYYFNTQSQFYLSDIAEKIKSKLNILKGSEIAVGGLGYFKGDSQKVIFLDVTYPDSFRDFNIALREMLKKFSASDNNLSFHPHMTVGKIRAVSTQKSDEQSVSDLERRLNKVHWTFPIKEIVLYGVDSTKSPQYQEKLTSFII